MLGFFKISQGIHIRLLFLLDSWLFYASKNTKKLNGTKLYNISYYEIIINQIYNNFFSLFLDHICQSTVARILSFR